MAELNEIRIKERNAEYMYESFERYYRQGEMKEACQSFWKSAQLVIAGIASFRAKEINTFAEAKEFLQDYVLKGEISAQEVAALEMVYSNYMRGTVDEAMLSVQIERAKTLLKKLKNILKDYMVNGPPQDSTPLPGNEAVSGENSNSGDLSGEDESKGSKSEGGNESGEKSGGSVGGEGFYIPAP
ncbi:MAG: hypothetical protein ACP5E4_01870 [Candidatus Aenigmatarchaeota archaeon]